ncbi:hypothetical protein M426DRAFT_255160 [Hypoxylon sp. CI-4A]|nr:hypothetical protein M426DRAFT_255160 [Hypoxylon sp. CI-4A]
MQQVFMWICSYINRYIGWREKQLRRTARAVQNQRRGDNAEWNRIKNQYLNTKRQEVQSVNKAYADFLVSVKALMEEAKNTLNLSRQTWGSFIGAIDTLRQEVRSSVLNNGNSNYWYRQTQQWPREADEYPPFSFQPVQPPYNMF